MGIVETDSIHSKMDLNVGQQAALKGIKDVMFNEIGSTLLLQGPAGTGKTAVLGQILQQYIAAEPEAS